MGEMNSAVSTRCESDRPRQADGLETTHGPRIEQRTFDAGECGHIDADVVVGGRALPSLDRQSGFVPAIFCEAAEGGE